MPRRNTLTRSRAYLPTSTTLHVLPDGTLYRTSDPYERAILTAQGSPPVDPHTARTYKRARSLR